MRVVLDTNVVLSAFRSARGASNAVLRLVDERRIVPVATVTLFLEYEAVLKRSEQREVHGLSLADVDLALGELAQRLTPVETHYLWRPQLRDADDDMVLEAAINGRASAIVTHNGDDFGSTPGHFGIQVLSPARLLEMVRQ